MDILNVSQKILKANLRVKLLIRIVQKGENVLPVPPFHHHSVSETHHLFCYFLIPISSFFDSNKLALNILSSDKTDSCTVRKYFPAISFLNIQESTRNRQEIKSIVMVFLCSRISLHIVVELYIFFVPTILRRKLTGFWKIFRIFNEISSIGHWSYNRLNNRLILIKPIRLVLASTLCFGFRWFLIDLIRYRFE